MRTRISTARGNQALMHLAAKRRKNAARVTLVQHEELRH